MILLLNRHERNKRFTGGRLYVWKRVDEGESCGIELQYLCDTLEDTWRDLNGVLGERERKVFGKTCIPDGEYEILMNIPSPLYLNKFKKHPNHPLAYTEGLMPRLMNIPQFSGVLIHAGNTVEDTNGCLLVGERTGNCIKGGTSTPAFNKLYALLKEAAGNGEKITISIQNTWS